MQLAQDLAYEDLGPFKFVPPPKRYKIGELSSFTGLSRQTLHNYTQWGLISHVSWTEGGHRLYDEAVFERLALIMKLRTTLTVDEMLLRLGGPMYDPPCPAA